MGEASERWWREMHPGRYHIMPGGNSLFFSGRFAIPSLWGRRDIILEQIFFFHILKSHEDSCIGSIKPVCVSVCSIAAESVFTENKRSDLIFVHVEKLSLNASILLVHPIGGDAKCRE